MPEASVRMTIHVWGLRRMTVRIRRIIMIIFKLYMAGRMVFPEDVPTILPRLTMVCCGSEPTEGFTGTMEANSNGWTGMSL